MSFFELMHSQKLHRTCAPASPSAVDMQALLLHGSQDSGISTSPARKRMLLLGAD